MLRSWLMLVLLLAMLPGVSAQTGKKLGLSPEDQKRHDELMRSAKRDLSIAQLAMQIGAGLMAASILYGAYSTYRYGFKITSEMRLEGISANVLAAVLVVAGIAVAVFAVFFLPAFLPR